jgi:hypothetical protein
VLIHRSILSEFMSGVRPHDLNPRPLHQTRLGGECISVSLQRSGWLDVRSESNDITFNCRTQECWRLHRAVQGGSIRINHQHRDGSLPKSTFPQQCSGEHNGRGNRRDERPVVSGKSIEHPERGEVTRSVNMPSERPSNCIAHRIDLMVYQDHRGTPRRKSVLARLSAQSRLRARISIRRGLAAQSIEPRLGCERSSVGSQCSHRAHHGCGGLRRRVKVCERTIQAEK